MGGSLSGALQTEVGATQQAERDISARDPKINELIAKQEALPKPGEPPAAPGDEDFKPPKGQDPMQAWGSTTSVLAMIAGLATRHPLTTALMSATAAINAVKANNADEYDRAFDKWKLDWDHAQKRFGMEMDQYRAGLDLYKTNIEAGHNLLEMYTTANGNSVLKQKLAEGNLSAIADYVKVGIEQQRLAMERYKPMAIQGEIFQQAIREFKQANNGRNPSAVEMSQMWQKTQTMASASTMGPDDFKFLAQRFLAGDKTAIQGLGYGNTGAANRAMLQHYIATEAKEEGLTGGDVAKRMAEYAGLVASERAVGTRGANIEIASTEFNNVAPQALAASAAIPRNSFQPFARAIQAGQTAFNDPRLAKLSAATNALMNLYARAISPSGVPTVSDKDHARDILSRVNDQASYAAVVQMMGQEIKAAQESPLEARSALEDEYTPGSSPALSNNRAHRAGTKENPYLPQSPQDLQGLQSGDVYLDPRDNKLRTIP